MTAQPEEIEEEFVSEPRGVMLPPDFDWSLLFPDDEVNTDWMDFALCVETDPELFFPAKHIKPIGAQSICRRCEVQDECLDYALVTRTPEGVWGAVSARARRKMRGDLIRNHLNGDAALDGSEQEVG